MYKLHVSANSGHHQVYYRFKRKSYIWVGVLIKRSLVSIFSLNVWCGYCNQYENYFLSITITNGVCPLGAAHIHWLSWMPSLP